MGLNRLIYASRAAALRKPELEDILDACRRNNPARHLTGMLLFDNGWFVQLLEGPRAAITERFCRIAADSRHEAVEIVTAGAIDTRLFPDWSMHYVASAGPAAQMLKRYACGPRFEPLQMGASGIEKLCLDVATMADLQDGGMRGVA